LADQTVTIRFEGRPLACRTGTSVAAALWENGIRDLSHSPKYGRPRGVTCARGQCTACLMRVDGVPNVRVCETPVHEGMDVRRQDTGAFYGAPMQRVLAAGDGLFPVGFYYKWFTRPPFVSRAFLRGIRPLTGIGRLPDRSATLRALPAATAATAPARDLGRWDTVVVGAGAAGLRAAAVAGGRVLLLDENAEPGGLRLAALRELRAAGVLERCDGLARALATLDEAVARAQDAGVTLRLGARVVAGYAGGGLLVRTGSELATLQAERVVWAGGALDAPGLFPGNDVPGCLGPRALLRLLVRDGLVVRGMPVLVTGSGLDLRLAAALLTVRGAQVSLVVTGPEHRHDVAAAVEMKWPLTTGLALASLARGAQGRVAAVFAPAGTANGPGASHLRLEADLVVVCSRGKPAYDVPFQLGAELVLDPARGGFVAPDDALLPGRIGFAAVGEAGGHRPEDVLGTEVTP